MSDKNSSNKISLYNRWLNGIEAVGNKLPHPVALFAMLALLIILISAVCAALGVSATGELVSDGELKETTVTAVSLLTKDGLAYIFSNAVSNFTSYAPLGMVLVAMLGVGVAEHSGLINALLKRTVQVTPKRLITPVVVFLGVMSNVAFIPWPVWPPLLPVCPAASRPICSLVPWTPCWWAFPRQLPISLTPPIMSTSWAITISSASPRC